MDATVECLTAVTFNNEHKSVHFDDRLPSVRTFQFRQSVRLAVQCSRHNMPPPPESGDLQVFRSEDMAAFQSRR